MKFEIVEIFTTQPSKVVKSFEASTPEEAQKTLTDFANKANRLARTEDDVRDFELKLVRETYQGPTRILIRRKQGV